MMIDDETVKFSPSNCNLAKNYKKIRKSITLF